MTPQHRRGAPRLEHHLLLASVLLGGCGIVVFERERDPVEGAGGAAGATTGVSATSVVSSTGVTGDGAGGAGGGPGGGGSGGSGGSAPPIETPYAGGTRLVPRVIEGGDGARIFLDFWDRELEVPCRFAPITGGGDRCVPVARAAFFADATCADPVIRVEECGEASLTTRFEDAACGAVAVEVFAPTGEVSVDVPYTRGAGGACTMMGGDPVTLARATRMDLAALVAGEETVDAVAGDLTARVARGDDGSHVVLGLGRGAMPCRPTDLGDGPRCVDSVTASRSFELHANDTCSDGSVVVTELDGCTPPPTLAREPVADPGGCEGGFRLHEIGADLPQVWRQVGQSCGTFEAEGYTFARQGPPVSLELLPRLDEVPLGAGRLVTTLWGRGEGGLWSSDAVFEDRELATRCRLGATIDGELRCIPETNLAAAGVFADPACTVPVIRPVEAPSPGCAPPPAARYLPRYADAGCGTLAVAEVWERGDALEELAVFNLNTSTGECTASSNPFTGSRVIAIHPPSELAPLSIAIVDP